MSVNKRRSFLKQAAAGIAVSGSGALPLALTEPAVAEPIEATAKERQRLIEEAHFGPKKPASSQGGMAICSHPLATREAVDILKRGGNACDAAMAASVTQTVVEPHMTTITGCLCFLYYDAATGKTSYLNGNVNAPLASLPGFNVGDLATGRGVAVPGWWAGFEAGLARHGSLPKKDIVAGAVRHAREGFETHPFLWGEIFVQSQLIGLTEQGREMYMPKGFVPRPGEMLFQKRAADTLERLAEEGNDYYYHGEFAEKMVKIVQEAGGVLTREDLEKYEVRWQEPAWGSYRGYNIAGSPPPDNGGTHIIEMLNMVELLDLEKLGPPTDSSETLLQMVRIANEVYSAGARQNDPESHPLPLETILSKDYAKYRFDLLQMGNPKGSAASPPPAGSNHVTVVDKHGNVATILHSCMSMPWSNGLFVDGISICAAGAHFFRVMPKPGHRISAYVAPNMLFKDGKPLLASGSPSVGLLQNVLQNTVNILDFGIPIEESVLRPRFGGPSLTTQGATMIEVDIDEKVREAVASKSIVFEVVNPWNFHHGAFEGIYIDPATGERRACGDPRRCSKAEGV
jgi:gamma-glutamyltranspeptidase/glutathione hydrolase